MTRSMLNRTVLLALLPLIALILYIEGQTYDPALISFTSSDIGSGDEARLFPRTVDGFMRSGVVRIYSKDNLYEYVDGHAEYFLSAGFVKLAVGEYVKVDSGAERPDIIIEIYDMGKAIQAFGVLSDEIGGNATTVQIGMIGAKTAQGLSFASGKYYVKITSFQDTMRLDTFAARIDETIGASPDALTEFALLPDIKGEVSTRFVKEAYRGLGFANNVIEREYVIQGKTFQLSLMTGSGTNIGNVLSSYLAFFMESETPYEEIEKNGQVLYKVMDPYEGDWYLIPFSDSLFGIYGEINGEILDRLLASITEIEQKR